MNTKVLCACFFKLYKRLFHLFLGHSVLGVAGSVHYLNLVLTVSHAEHTAGVVTAADCFGYSADLLDKLYMSVVVEVNYCAEVVCLLHILSRSYV